MLQRPCNWLVLTALAVAPFFLNAQSTTSRIGQEKLSRFIWKMARNFRPPYRS